LDILIEGGNGIDSNFHLNDGFELANQTGRTSQNPTFGAFHINLQVVQTIQFFDGGQLIKSEAKR